MAIVSLPSTSNTYPLPSAAYINSQRPATVGNMNGSYLSSPVVYAYPQQPVVNRSHKSAALLGVIAGCGIGLLALGAFIIASVVRKPIEPVFIAVDKAHHEQQIRRFAAEMDRHVHEMIPSGKAFMTRQTERGKRNIAASYQRLFPGLFSKEELEALLGIKLPDHL
jgi:hypothetical protein